MRTLLKIAGAVAAALVVAAVAGFFALKRLLPPERVRELVVTGAQKALGREVRLGEVSIGLVSGLTLKDFSIAEAGGFSSGTFASVAAFNVRVRWAPLLEKKVVVDSVQASGLALRVVKKDDGSFNFSPLLAGTGTSGAAAGSSAQAAGAASVALAVRSFRLSGGAVDYDDPAGKVSVKVAAIEAKASGFSLNGPFPADVSARVAGTAGGSPVDGSVSFSGKLDLGGQDPKKFLVSAKTLEASSAGWTLRASGTVSDLTRLDSKLKLSVRGPSGPLADGEFAGDVALPQGGSPLKIRGRADLACPGVSAKQAAAYGLPAPVPAFKASWRGVVTPKAADIQALSVELPQGKLEAAGTVAGLDLKRPVADLTVTAALDLPAIRAEDAPWLKLPKGVSAPAMKVDGKARLKGDDVELSGVSVRTSAGTVEAAGTVRKLTSGAPEPNLDVVAKLSLPALRSADIPVASVPPGLAMPASQWDAAAAVSLDEVKLRALRAIIGHNDFQIDNARLSGLRSAKPSVDVLVKCRKFQLDELTAMSEATKDMKLAGGGFFVLGATGKLPRPVLQGKLQFKDLGADVAGLKLAGFTGTATFNEKRIDVPNLRGQVGDGELQMDLTLKNYVSAPEVELEASLTRFDLGKFLAAKAAVTKQAPAAAPKAGEAVPAQAPPLSTKGKFVVQQLIHPNAQARDLKLDWDLYGITPDFKQLNGSAKIYSAGGKFSNLEALASQLKLAKILLSPIMIIQKVGSLGFIKLFDFNNIEYAELAGDYRIHSGIMELADSHLYGATAQVVAEGTIDLPNEKPDLSVTAKASGIIPISLSVGGTFENLKVRPNVGKILAEPAKQLLEGLLKH